MIKKLFPVMLLGFSLSSQAIATSYTYKTIDPPAGALAFMLIKAINDKGQVVGTYYENNSRSHGFIYANGLFTTLDVPNEMGLSTELTDINNNGQIIGSYSPINSSIPVYQKHGFLYSNGTFTTIDSPKPILGRSTDYIETTLSGINDKGQIVGNSVIFTKMDPVRPIYSTNTNAFIYNAGNVVDIFVGQQPTCVDINASGQAVCKSPYNLDVLFYDSVNPLNLPLPYPLGVDVYSLNDSGQFVGGIHDNPATGQTFLYSNGAFKTLPNTVLPGGSFVTTAMSINAKGQIVGYYYDDQTQVFHGFVNDGGTYKPFDIPGANSTSIHKNNASGQLLGSFEDSTGRHYFIATPITAKPTTEKQCKKNGWKTFGFKNRKACIKYVESLDEDEDD